MIKDTVKTESRAKEIILEYVNDNHLTNGSFKDISDRCECGETQAIQWTNFKDYLTVAICESCGDDDAFISDVLQK